MTRGVVTVVQCWDDGVAADARLADILRRHGAKAAFNLNARLHQKQSALGGTYKGTEIWRLGWDDMKDVYKDFTIANHSLTHPRLDQLTTEAARRDIVEGRDRLQQFFGQPVRGFAHPFGSYNEAAMAAAREAGHAYARTTVDVEQPFPPEYAMAFHPCCHFRAPDFWARYETSRKSGVFYFWGHSFEMITEGVWKAFEDMIARFSADPAARWGEVAELFGE